MSYWGILLLGAIGFVTAMAVAPTVAALAWRLKITDRPDGNRKLHNRPVPLGGGVCIYLGLWTAVFVGMWLREPCGLYLRRVWPDLLMLFYASSAIVAIGLIDDRFNLRGWHKLLGQMLAGSILVMMDFRISAISLFGVEIDFGIWSIPVTMFWLVGAMNSLNLLDGVDGLATTVGIVLSLAIGVVALLFERYTEALVIAGLVGGMCGFLRFNLPPAKMFLGDAGSMLIGLIVGALAIRSALKGPTTVALAAPLAVWTIPIFDSTAAILRRKLTGRSIYASDRGHLHHRLMARSGSASRTLLWVVSCCIVTSIGALFSLWLKNDTVAIVTSLCVMGTLIATRVFGHVELQLVADGVRRLGGNVMGMFGAREITGFQSAVRLQGTRPWDQLWLNLLEFTDKFNLHSMRLDVNMPACHEAYHASWTSPVRCPPNELWRTEIPLFADKHVLGRLTILGRRDQSSVCDVVARLADFLYPFECRLMEIANEQVAAARAQSTSLQDAAAGAGKVGAHAANGLTPQGPATNGAGVHGAAPNGHAPSGETAHGEAANGPTPGAPISSGAGAGGPPALATGASEFMATGDLAQPPAEP